jgi:uncharacterized protein (DUF433 family)
VLTEQRSNLAELNKLFTSALQTPVPRVSKTPAPRQKQRRFTAAENVEIARAYQAGASMQSIADHYGVRRQTISTRLRRLATPLRNQALQPDQLPQVIALYESGWSLARVGEHFGCDAESIRSALKRAGVPRRDAHDHHAT